MKTDGGQSRFSVDFVHRGGRVELLDGDFVANHGTLNVSSQPMISTGATFDVALGSLLELTGGLSGTGLYRGTGDGQIIATTVVRGLDQDFTLDFDPELLRVQTPERNVGGFSGFITNDGDISFDSPERRFSFSGVLTNNGTLT